MKNSGEVVPSKKGQRGKKAGGVVGLEILSMHPHHPLMKGQINPFFLEKEVLCRPGRKKWSNLNAKENEFLKAG